MFWQFPPLHENIICPVKPVTHHFRHLKAYGNDFAGNGFQLKDKDAPRYYVDTGDEELSLIRDFPIGFKF